jgi:acetylornithine deacetylase/succinyl-diaminopimelate desuccinylase-like protein
MDVSRRVRNLTDRLMPVRDRLRTADESILATQVAIAEIPAPTGAEGLRAAWIARRLAALGLSDLRHDEAGNVVARRRGTVAAAPVVVCAHLDTVFEGHETISVRRTGGRLFAPGIGDNARGLATMLALAAEFAPGRLAPRRPILFAATTGEEGAGDLRGARHLFDTVARGAHAAIAIDGAGDERVVASALGCRRYRVEFHGVGGHSWAAYGTPNAVHAAARLGASLAAIPLPDRPRTTLTVARIGGGTAVNAIPAHAWLELDVRSTATEALQRLDRLVRAAAHDALEDENARRRPGAPPLHVTVIPLGERPAGEVPMGEAIVETALEATRCLGRCPEMAVASTDANVPIALGIPAVAIGGGGRGGDTHTPHEWFENHEGARGVMRALVLLAALSDAA